MIEFLENLTLGLLAAAGVLALLRVGRPGSLPEKVLGADTMILVLASGIAAGAGITGETAFLDALVIVTLLGFVGTITVARYIERRGARP